MGHPLFRRYPQIAHLFDMDANRLRQTAQKLGVRVIKIERAGTDKQHIDLCGGPFERAKKICERLQGR
jgi:fructose-specific phosphotransferase system component IIB